MIGQNDTASDRFELSAAADLAAFAHRHRLGRISMWSLNRDRACSDPVAAGGPARSDCSGVAQPPSAFTRTLGGEQARRLSKEGFRVEWTRAAPRTR